MDLEYPPLPPSRAQQFSSQGLDNTRPHTPGHVESSELHPTEPGSAGSSSINLTKVISRNGDVLVDYNDHKNPVFCQWKVSSEDLILNSPYFRALLDRNKFSEGRNLMEQKMCLDSLRTDDRGTVLSDETRSLLPRVNLPVDEFSRKFGIDAIELLLRILCFNSLTDEEKGEFEVELKFKPLSIVGRLVEVADYFNSQFAVRDMLKRTGYAFGKSRVVLNRFHSALLKLREERIRLMIFIAEFLDVHPVFQVMTHTLIIAGSKLWMNGISPPTSDAAFRWQYFSGGLEEELYYRRQCVLNTIADLQSCFLRVYGALEEPGPSSTQSSIIAYTGPRKLQCRWGTGNSSACDVFHLGQMTRFFTLRTKTVFLGSNLIDPDFTLETETDYDTANATERPHSGPPDDITSIIASLKQYPDYQIDSDHMGCGVRRRLIPALDTIEKYIADSNGLLGLDAQNKAPLSSTFWTNHRLPRVQIVRIRPPTVDIMRYADTAYTRALASQDEARLLFTARARNWEV